MHKYYKRIWWNKRSIKVTKSSFSSSVILMHFAGKFLTNLLIKTNWNRTNGNYLFLYGSIGLKTWKQVISRDIRSDLQFITADKYHPLSPWKIRHQLHTDNYQQELFAIVAIIGTLHSNYIVSKIIVIIDQYWVLSQERGEDWGKSISLKDLYLHDDSVHCKKY